MVDHITTHVAIAQSRMAQQFQGKPKISQLIADLVAPIQAIEDAAWQMLTQLGVDAAEGVNLDRIGVIVGEKRLGKVDAIYRNYIRAAIRAHKSNGTVEDLIRVTRLIVNDPATKVVVDPSVPLALTITVLSTTYMAADAALSLIRFLKLSAAATARVVLDTSPALAAQMMTLPISTFMSTLAAVGSTTLAAPTAGFPISGSLRLDAGTSTEEVVTYTSHNPTTFQGVSATIYAHTTRSTVSLEDGALGFGDTTNAATGGYLASSLS